MSRRMLIAPAVVLVLAAAGCVPGKKTASSKGIDPEAPVVTGAALYTADYPAAGPDEPSGPEPVSVPLAHVVIHDKSELPSKVDGSIRWLGVETTRDEAARLGLTGPDLYENLRDHRLYRSLKPGEVVKKGQIVGFLDDDQAYVEFIGASKRSEAAAAEATAYRGTANTLLKIEKQYMLAKPGTVPMAEILQAQAQTSRYEADAVSREGAAKVAAAELDKAKLILDRHTLKAPLDGEVQQVLRHPGDGVKNAEPVLVIYNFDKLRAEGNLPKEYIGNIRAGDEIVVEAPRDIPFGITFKQHTTNVPVTALTVGTREGKAVVVSGGEDGWVYAWATDLKVIGAWKQRSAVRALAVTRPAVAAPLLLVGSDDGSAKVYDLAAADRDGPPLRELDGRHDGGVTAAAFSPDGRYCVTSDERAIYLWDVSTGKKKYAFPAREHHSTITGLHFTPQGRVVSAGKEPSVLVWMVGETGAKVERRFEARTGDVAAPGVTDDGTQLLLDARKAQLDIVHLADGRKGRPLEAAGEAARFQTFTAWSPEMGPAGARLIAAAGGDEGVVHLFRAPSPTERGSEYARLVCKDNAPATCVAFAPASGTGFVVVGTRHGAIHWWSLPTVAELKAELSTTVTFVEQAIESSGRTARILVDFENPKRDGRYALRPGTAVTLVIKPRK